MSIALTLAQRGLGNVWPNPAVGCVIVQDGRIVGRGWTQPGGRPHAETEALRRAGSAARGATAYVTLEPCAHHGKTPPCADALIAAGIERVVAAHRDPDPRVGGSGLAALDAAGIAVEEGCRADDARAINAGFLSRLERKRPLVTLKAATSLDGRIATRTGESRWITGGQARAHGHLLRASHDAVLVGIGTAVTDDPALTCRLPGMAGCAPVRVVIDGRARLPISHALLAGARDHPTWIVSSAALGFRSRRAAYQRAGAEIIEVAAGEGHRPDPRLALEALAARGVTRVLVEGGGRLAGALMRLRLVDRIAWFRAPSLIGDDGIAAVAPFGVDRIEDAPRFVRASLATLGPDLLETLVPAS
jgi:diaminohydroxyphosphoribosylaminopyrimidine deaminase/5-amino-6-(5-phosphoribosylamino)uracil reductase